MKTLDRTKDYDLDRRVDRKEQRASSCLKRTRSKRLRHDLSQRWFGKEVMAVK
jgi:hypothetical protein